LVDVKITAS
jgi:hypothetical protein